MFPGSFPVNFTSKNALGNPWYKNRNPKPPGNDLTRYRRNALMKEILFPAMSVTISPTYFFPRVACVGELSIPAKYNPTKARY